jgi:hypothetical protein
MADLSQFKYDVFLSYGWSGLVADVGDRLWVTALKNELQAQISAELGRQARIFFDVEQPQNGDLAANLDAAAAASAAFVSVITPGSCKKDSWCHRELDAFLTHGTTILPKGQSLFALRLRDVAIDQWPTPLQAVAPYEFLTKSLPRGPLPVQHIADTTTSCGANVQKLGIDLAAFLGAAAAEVERTVLFAAASPVFDERLKRLVVEIEARGGRAVRVSQGKDEDEQAFSDRLVRELRGARFSIHMLTSADPVVPAGWHEPIEYVQVRHAAARFAADPQGMIRWRESGRTPDGATSPPSAAPTSTGQAALTEGQMLEGTGFEYLHSLILDLFRRTREVSEARRAAHREVAEADKLGAAHRNNGNGRGVPAAPPRYVFLDCVHEDLYRLASTLKALRDAGFLVKVPLFQGDPEVRTKADREFLARCDEVAVFFGSRNDLQTYLACQSIANAIRERRLTIRRAVLLDPPDDPVRQCFLFPEFTNYPCMTPDAFVAALRPDGA